MKPTKRMRAAQPHLLASMLLLLACAATVVFAWYPSPFLVLSGPGAIAALLVVVACVVGPALTWLVATPGKARSKLRFDLTVIGLIQLTAMAWGMYNLSLQKPHFMVFTLDRFEVLARRDVVDPIENPAFLDKPLIGPVMLYADMPTDSQAFQLLLQEVMFEGKPDLQYRPEFWSVYEQRRQQAAQVARPLSDLRAARPADAADIDALVETNGGDISRFGFVPAMMRNGAFTVVLDAVTGHLVGSLETNPWLD